MEPKKRKRRRILIGVVSAILVIVLAVLAFAGNYLFEFAIERKYENAPDVEPDSITSDEAGAVMDANREWITAQCNAWLETAVHEEAKITSADGLGLKGSVYLAEESTHKWAFVIHGYGGKKENMLDTACFFALEGYNVFLPDLRGHGQSEGKYFGMGWLDRKDILSWIDYIISIDNEAEIILYGVSMGGATVMMVSGEELPSNVKGIVEDCGYATVWDIFSDELDYIFGLPEFPLLYSASAVCKLRAGYTFGEVSAVDQVSKAKVPMLFIHGTADSFVMPYMVEMVYEACPTTKDVLIIEGAGHCEAYCMNPELYFDKVFGFIDENCIK